MKSVILLKFKISFGSYNDFVNEIIKKAIENISSYVCVANVHMFVEGYRNQDFLNIVNNADIVTPDGMPLVAALKLIDNVNQERVAGMDLLPSLLKEANSRNLSIFFYGGTDEMMKTTMSFVKSNYPTITNINFYSPPFRQLSLTEEEEVVELINKATPNIVFVVLGCPKQEKWMNSMKGKINSCMIGIGGALPVMIGLQKRAPIWMQKSSLEWLYRLIQDPKRLFKRYLVTNSIFIYLILLEIIKTKLLRLKPSITA